MRSGSCLPRRGCRCGRVLRRAARSLFGPRLGKPLAGHAPARARSPRGPGGVGTNLPERLDPRSIAACSCRMSLEVPPPQLRESIWGLLGPPPPAAGRCVDLGALAKRYDFSGGYIKRCRCSSAASERGGGAWRRPGPRAVARPRARTAQAQPRGDLSRSPNARTPRAPLDALVLPTDHQGRDCRSHRGWPETALRCAFKWGVSTRPHRLVRGVACCSGVTWHGQDALGRGDRGRARHAASTAWNSAKMVSRVRRSDREEP